MMLAWVICKIVPTFFGGGFKEMVTSNSSENNALNQTTQCDLGQFIVDNKALKYAKLETSLPYRLCD